MKRLILLVELFLVITTLNAQWVSPGNGTTYTLDDLVEIGCVLHDDANATYAITTDITISATDKLYISIENTQIAFLFNEDDLTLTIKGSMIVEGGEQGNYYVGMPEDAQHGLIRFEDASEPSHFAFCNIFRLSGIQIINSDVTFEHCKIAYFDDYSQSSAVNFLNCDPVFTECTFYLNEGAALSSPANGQGSPQLTNCIVSYNVRNNGNQPQINLGPGSQDTIRIVGCQIIGSGQEKSGGISIADLMGTGDTKILLKDNLIGNNRYGYNQQGYRLNSTIIGNSFIDNNLETNPMNGGSGISIYGMDENNKAYIRNNVISGNLWGITIINAADIDLGTEDDWGYNEIKDNGNEGVIYDLYNNSTSDIIAVGNDWGTTDEKEVEDHIVHQIDNPNLGLVNYIPFIGYDAVNEYNANYFEIWPNPAQGCFTVEGSGVMTITNTLGQTIMTQEINGKETIGLARGFYFVKIGNTTHKVIVE